MQSAQPPPSFASFLPQSDDDQPKPGPSRSTDGTQKKRHHSHVEHTDGHDRERPKKKSSSRKSTHNHHRSIKQTSMSDVRGIHNHRRRKLPEREEASLQPIQHDLPFTGTSYYEDRLGNNGSLFLEARWYDIQGRRQVLGVPKHYRIERDQKTGQFQVFVPLRFGSKPNYTIRALKAAANVKTRRILPAAAAIPKDEEEGFIPISKPSKPTDSQDDPPYRSITEQDVHSGEDSSSGEEGALGWPESDDDAIDTYSAETTRLAQILSADTSNVSSWLNVIAHSASTNPTPAGRADIWITMLEKAMLANSANKTSEALRLRYLEVIREARSRSEEETAWTKALDEIKSENLWVEYIGFRLRKGGAEALESAISRVWKEVDTFGDNELRKYHARLRIFWRAVVGLREAGYLERALAAIQGQVELMYMQPRVLEDQPFASVRDALEEFWDADMPRIGEPNAQGWISWLKDDDAKKRDLPSFAVPVVSNSSLGSPPGLELEGYQRWLEAEQKLDADGWLPLRQDDDNGDPYSTVLFSDIRPLLFPPPKRSGNEETMDETVLYVFLQFLGLHIPGLSDSLLPSRSGDLEEGIDSTWSYSTACNDDGALSELFSLPTAPSSSATSVSRSLSTPSMASNPIPISTSSSNRALVPNPETWNSFNGVVIGPERRMGNGWGPIKEWTFGTRVPLEGHGGPESHCGDGRMWEKNDLRGINVDFVRRLFQQVDSRLKSESWSEYWTAFEAAADVKEALKVSKSILASFPNSLRLWSVHAHLQRIRGKTDLARKVYQACLLSPPPASSSWLFEANAADRMHMWWCWAEMEWLERRDDDAMRLLFSAVGVSMPPSDPNSPSSSASIQIPLLRARKAYDRALTISDSVAPGTTVTTMNMKTYISVLNCFALLEILHTRSVLATLELYAQYRSSPASASERAATRSAMTRNHRFLDESLAVSSSLLILHFTHTLRNVSPPALLRKHVNDAMRRYPGNSILLGVWLESERGEAVWGRVRSGVADVVLGQGVKEGRRGKGVSVTRVLWSVWVEKWERGVWDGRKARHVLRNAVEDPRLARCVGLWMALIHLEIGLGNLKAAKGTVYQATEACPWHKGFYLLAFGPLREMFTSAELVQALNTMAERGIRLRAAHAIEDYVEAEENEGGGGAEEQEDWGEAELEEESMSLQRLKPY